ncbi:Zinc/iron permease [Podospora appendiculata]|uniref:Zinc/iron permease n=1 Tax=Podospora appendiculata TaxID=314037 RepID=A0AAE0XEK3_9PEZI|nr:Zinc/iron permease [Podospora appendiculata]
MRHHHYSHLMARQEGEPAPICEGSIASADHWGLRIASIFIIFAGSALGALLPVWLARSSKFRVPKLCFFVAKYFGSGVILATAWMHLLSPASDNLRDECLSDILPDYDWAMGIGLMTVMTMFLIELVVARFDFGFSSGHSHGHEPEHSHENKIAHTTPTDSFTSSTLRNDLESGIGGDSTHSSTKPSSVHTTAAATTAANPTTTTTATAHSHGHGHGHGHNGPHRIPGLDNDVSYPPGGEDHLGHQRDHTEGDEHANYAAQMTALFILEFGVIFHSIFIGLTLAVTDNFIILFIVLVFHQTFEGLGLGARLGTAVWPADGRRWTPYLLAGLYAVSTPFAIGMGLIANRQLALDAATSKMVNGIFDAISGGILMYTGLVELLAHEFMFNPEMRKAGLGMQLFAYACVAAGVGLMSLLAKWA